MEFMDEKQAREQKTISDQIIFYKDVIRVSEIYERLDSNADFKKYLSDMNDSVTVIDGNIQALVDRLDQDTNLFKSLRSFNILQKHAIERNALIYYRDRAKNVIQAGKNAQEQLSQLTEGKKEAVHV